MCVAGCYSTLFPWLNMRFRHGVVPFLYFAFVAQAFGVISKNHHHQGPCQDAFHLCFFILSLSNSFLLYSWVLYPLWVIFYLILVFNYSLYIPLTVHSQPPPSTILSPTLLPFSSELGGALWVSPSSSEGLGTSFPTEVRQESPARRRYPTYK